MQRDNLTDLFDVYTTPAHKKLTSSINFGGKGKENGIEEICFFTNTLL